MPRKVRENLPDMTEEEIAEIKRDMLEYEGVDESDMSKLKPRESDQTSDERKGMKVYLVTFADHDQAHTLNEAGSEHRMLSYAYLKDRHPDTLKNYLKYGIGKYVDEEGEKVRKMSPREFLENLKYKKEDKKDDKKDE